MRGVFVALAMAMLAATPASAHRGHDAISVVMIEKDGTVTVSHRFEAHDIEPALARIAPNAQTSLDDPDAIAALEAYLARRFTLIVDGKPVALAHRATDLSTAEVRVDFAGRARGRIDAVTLRSGILTDVYPRQQHQVNVRARGTVRTVQLSGGTARTVSFE
ncbi:MULTISPECIES: DUF6702 family protein [unclassified Sphingomonas]|uniref:DUF6702 family protein n=1 Tax=unclassified Sphingomonas TaxID=196159 RepID=UPI000A52E13B|nr:MULTISPECIES: DUF6702 family protein [unclassified Sphingomonas]